MMGFAMGGKTMGTRTAVSLLVFVYVFALAAGTCFSEPSPAVYAPKCEYKTNPLGIDVKEPRLSWKIASSRRAVKQSAYQIRADMSFSTANRTTSYLERYKWDAERKN
jgi:hypothetical protein